MTSLNEFHLEEMERRVFSVPKRSIAGFPVNRSKALTGWRRLAALAVIASFLGYVFYMAAGWLSWNFWIQIVFGTATVSITTTVMISGVFWRSFKHLPPAPGRVLAIIPVFNEPAANVHASVRALINQTIPPQAIHVVDDGSSSPLKTFEHPLVTWHHTKNQGKRHAQAHVLNKFSPNQWDFILTVDSDSVADADALEHLLRSMTNSNVQAATGMIYTRNWDDNLLTRLTDINLVTSCLMFRMFRSWFGLVTPTSGALALYRTAVVYDNLDEYLVIEGGGCGDDRRLSFYAHLRGEVVGVHEAVVETNLPTSVPGMFKQRMRWSKSAWLGVKFVVPNFKLIPLTLYVYPLMFTLMCPPMLAVLIKLSTMFDDWWILGRGVAFWMIVSVCQTAIYTLYRPGLSSEDRFKQLVRGLIYPFVGLFILRPASYYALTQLKSASWATRENVVEEKVEAG